MSERKEYSVCAFYDKGPNAGRHSYIDRWMVLEDALKCALSIINKVKDPTIHRIIITNGGDSIVFEWERNKGVVWPDKPVLTIPPGDQGGDCTG